MTVPIGTAPVMELTPGDLDTLGEGLPDPAVWLVLRRHILTGAVVPHAGICAGVPGNRHLYHDLSNQRGGCHPTATARW